MNRCTQVFARNLQVNAHDTDASLRTENLRDGWRHAVARKTDMAMPVDDPDREMRLECFEFDGCFNEMHDLRMMNDLRPHLALHVGASCA